MGVVAECGCTHQRCHCFHLAATPPAHANRPHAQAVPYDMSLASVKKYIWRKSEDVIFTYQVGAVCCCSWLLVVPSRLVARSGHRWRDCTRPLAASASKRPPSLRPTCCPALQGQPRVVFPSPPCPKMQILDPLHPTPFAAIPAPS